MASKKQILTTGRSNLNSEITNSNSDSQTSNTNSSNKGSLEGCEGGDQEPLHAGSGSAGGDDFPGYGSGRGIEEEKAQA